MLMRMCACVLCICMCVCVCVKIRRHQHTRVHAHTGPRRHARAVYVRVCAALLVPPDMYIHTYTYTSQPIPNQSKQAKGGTPRVRSYYYYYRRYTARSRAANKPDLLSSIKHDDHTQQADLELGRRGLVDNS